MTNAHYKVKLYLFQTLKLVSVLKGPF